MYFVLDSGTKDALMLSARAFADDGRREFPVKKGINEVLLSGEFRIGDKISIASQTGNPFVASKPIFFKRVPKPRRDLVFLISADTLAASHMGLYGYGGETTRNIEEFSRDAVVFDQAYANSTWTVSSHMSLFTSLLEHGHGVLVKKKYTTRGDDRFVVERKSIVPLSPSIPSLMEALAGQYLTFSFNGGSNVGPEFGFFRGFDLYISNHRDMDNPRAAEELFAKVASHLEKFAFPKAFYFLHTYQVHSPYEPLPEHLLAGEPKPRLARFDFYSDLHGMRGIYKPYSADFVREVIRLYDAEIRGFDAAFGSFLKYLKAHGLYDPSTIILLSDHGEEFLEHGSWMHSSDLYSDQLGVPLLIKFPGQEHEGKKIRVPVSLIDVMPTLLDSKRIAVPGKLHGHSLLELLAGKKLDRPSVIASLFRSKPDPFVPGKVSLVSGGFKLIYSEPYELSAYDFFNHTPPSFEPFELFDLVRDRRERNNIFDSLKKTPDVQRMLKEIVALVEAMKEAHAKNGNRGGTPASADLLNQLRSMGYL